MRQFLVFLLLFLTPALASAELKIAPDDHIQNSSAGLCAWCSLETLGLTHGWTQLRGLTASKTAPGYHADLVKELKNRKIAFRQHQAKDTECWYMVYFQKPKQEPVILYHSRDENEAKAVIKTAKQPGFYWIDKQYYYKSQFLWDALRDDLGAAVSIDGYEPNGRHWRHMLVITHMDNYEWWSVDSNHKPGVITKEPLKTLLERWNGFAIIIDQPTKLQ